MGLHLSLYVLVDQRELTSGQATAPMTRLDINEHMGLNRLIKDVSVHGKCQEGVVPVMSPSPVLRDFKLRDIAHGGPEDKSFDEFGTDFYGNPLTWVYADEFNKVVLSDELGEPSAFRVRAALAYIAELPPNTPIVLYWG